MDADSASALDRLLKLKGQVDKDGWAAQAKKLVDEKVV